MAFFDFLAVPLLIPLIPSNLNSRKYLALRQRNSQMRIQLKEKQRRPTLPYEKARRRIFKSIEPFWDFLQFRLLEMKTVTDPKGLTEQIDALLQSSRDYKM